MQIALFILVILVVIAWSMPRVRRVTRSIEGIYAKKLSVLTETEQRFLSTLEKVVGNRYRILCQVRVADAVELQIAPFSKGRLSAFNRISSKSFDFVLCDRQSTEPVLVIELNDSSHDLPERVKRDVFLERLCQSIGLPILFQNTQSSYDVFELQGRIATAIGPATDTARDFSSLALVEPDKEESPFGRQRPLRWLAILATLVAIPLILYIGVQVLPASITSSMQSTFDASKRATDKALSRAQSARNEQLAAEQREAQRDVLEKREQAARELSDQRLAQEKEKAWQRYYQPSDKCEHATDWNVTVECGNEHIRAKRAFEEKWRAEH